LILEINFLRSISGDKIKTLVGYDGSNVAKEALELTKNHARVSGQKGRG